ncbi:MAG: hypothetical protein AABY32_05065 [Nanoarchaeota archaeon]
MKLINHSKFFQIIDKIKELLVDFKSNGDVTFETYDCNRIYFYYNKSKISVSKFIRGTKETIKIIFEVFELDSTSLYSDNPVCSSNKEFDFQYGKENYDLVCEYIANLIRKHKETYQLLEKE